MSTELLVALIAAGCVCFGNPTVNRTGLVLLEIARVALNKLAEEDNSAVRTLEYLQASMIWLDVCSFCGYKRKMETAESNLQPLVTALRRFGKFDRAAYEDVNPAACDDDAALATKWRRWIECESFKRLVHHLFEHDILVCVTKYRQPIVSYAELSLPLPACRELWLAASSTAWRDIYNSMAHNGQLGSRALSVRHLLADCDLLKSIPPGKDGPFATSTALYGIAAEIWHWEQQKALILVNDREGDADDELWLRAKHQKLLGTLEKFRSNLDNASANINLTHQYLSMILFVRVDTVMRFAGKCGEHEAHVAYQELQAWSKGRQARLAIWHAGQVVRMARNILPFQLRGADGLLLYHALMVLWSYGMMLRDSARRTGVNTPVRGAQLGDRATLLATTRTTVFLDGAPCQESELFTQRDIGRPCLHQDSGTNATVCQLRNPTDTMILGSKLLEANCPGEPRARMPQMLKSLCGLMDELGALD